ARVAAASASRSCVAAQYARERSRASLCTARRIEYASRNIASMRTRWMGSLVSSASRSTETPSSTGRTHGVCLFGPRVRFSDDSIDRSYAAGLTMQPVPDDRVMHALARRPNSPPSSTVHPRAPILPRLHLDELGDTP